MIISHNELKQSYAYLPDEDAFHFQIFEDGVLAVEFKLTADSLAELISIRLKAINEAKRDKNRTDS